MPRRTRSHQLEDLSVQKFEQLLPEQWICRRKDKDYGVDLEVEIFSNDESTGLMFYVQLKATDDKAKECLVSMKVDRLEYLQSLDIPSMVVCYCHPTDALHWSWTSNIFANNPEPTGKSLGVRFQPDDRWEESDPSAIYRTLQTFRIINSGSRRIPIGLRIDTEGLSFNAAFELNYSVSQLREMTTLINGDSDPSACLPITLQLQEDMLHVSIDVISSVGVRLENVQRDEILNKLAYVIAYMIARYEFSVQALDVIRAIVRLGLITNSRYIASAVACSALSDPDLAAEVASRNRLHAYQDEAYLNYIDQILSSDVPIDTRIDAVRRFYTEAIEAHGDEHEVSQAALHYSLANFLRMSGRLSEAVRHYNLARKDNPDYLERGYFLAELGAALFYKNRFLLSAVFYTAAFNVESIARTAICAGDAHLFSGAFKQATDFYRLAETDSKASEFEGAEASLKIWLVEATSHFGQKNLVSGTFWISDPNHWGEVLNQALDVKRTAIMGRRNGCEIAQL